MNDKPRIDFQLRRLILLAGEVHDLLAAGEWEKSLPIQDEYDESFATFQFAVERGERLAPSMSNDLSRLHHVHNENIKLIKDMQAETGIERQRINNVRRITGYSPNATSGASMQRYVDGSA